MAKMTQTQIIAIKFLLVFNSRPWIFLISSMDSENS